MARDSLSETGEKNAHPARTPTCTRGGSGGESRPSQGHTQGTSDNVLGGVVTGVAAQGGELVPVPQEAPVVLACVHDEPVEEPAPRLLPQGLLDFPLGDVITDVDQLDEEDVRHARRDDHGVPHAGEGQSRAGRTKGGSAGQSFLSESQAPPSRLTHVGPITKDSGAFPSYPNQKMLFHPKHQSA